MIRAVYRNGTVQPLDDIPADWLEGEELAVEQTGGKLAPEELAEFDDWVAEINAAAARISHEDHERMAAALEEIERESKELGRREMERAHLIFAVDEGRAGGKEAGRT